MVVTPMGQGRRVEQYQGFVVGVGAEIHRLIPRPRHDLLHCAMGCCHAISLLQMRHIAQPCGEFLCLVVVVGSRV